MSGFCCILLSAISSACLSTTTMQLSGEAFKFSPEDTLYIGGVFPSGPWPELPWRSYFVDSANDQLLKKSLLCSKHVRSFASHRDSVFNFRMQNFSELHWQYPATMDTLLVAAFQKMSGVSSGYFIICTATYIGTNRLFESEVLFEFYVYDIRSRTLRFKSNVQAHSRILNESYLFERALVKFIESMSLRRLSCINLGN